MVQPFPSGTGFPYAYSNTPPYPGPPNIQTQFPYGPTFDGMYAHGLTNTPYTNSLFESVNALQHSIFTGSGVGFNPVPPGLFPPQPGM